MTKRMYVLILFILGILSAGGIVFGQGELTVHYTGMTPYIGKAFAARIVDLATRAEVERIALAKIEDESFDIVFSSLLKEDDYRIDFYIDMNGNGRYDPPPTDHAWHMEISDLSGAVSVDFQPTGEYTDIDWPPIIDGMIEPDEYRHTLTDPGTGMEVHWQNDDLVLYIGLVSQGTGWEAIGFAPTRKMQGANIIIGAVSDGQLTIENHYGSSPTSHREDNEDQLLQAAGREVNGKTVIEFSILLTSDDPNDVSIVPGTEVTIILAYHIASDRLTARHTKRSTNSITLDGEDS